MKGNTKRTYSRYLLILVFSFLSNLSAPLAEGQEPTNLSLGTVSGLPGGEVLVPMLLKPSPPELQIGEGNATIGFETKNISFSRAEKSFLLDGVKAGFESAIEKVATDSSRSRIRLVIATKGEPRKALLEGLLGTLIFRINKDAAAGAIVPLAFEAASAGDLNSPAKEIQPLASQDGAVEVIPSDELPYVPCFFFTH